MREGDDEDEGEGMEVGDKLTKTLGYPDRETDIFAPSIHLHLHLNADREREREKNTSTRKRFLDTIFCFARAFLAVVRVFYCLVTQSAVVEVWGLCAGPRVAGMLLPPLAA